MAVSVRVTLLPVDVSPTWEHELPWWEALRLLSDTRFRSLGATWGSGAILTPEEVLEIDDRFTPLPWMVADQHELRARRERARAVVVELFEWESGFG